MNEKKTTKKKKYRSNIEASKSIIKYHSHLLVECISFDLIIYLAYFGQLFSIAVSKYINMYSLYIARISHSFIKTRTSFSIVLSCPAIFMLQTG